MEPANSAAGMLEYMELTGAVVDLDPDLRLFLRPRYRPGPVLIPCDGVSSLGHLVQSLGVPLTEVGSLTVNGVTAEPRYRPAEGDRVRVDAMPRPQQLPDPRFVLDVHLGTLARRLRLLGVDSAYANDADDDALVDQANVERRALLTQDRGLLFRRTLWTAGYVRGAKPDDQLADVLDRFAPPLAPWTRCVACNGMLSPVSKADVDSVLLPGTKRTYRSFSRCADCDQVYWRGAHSDRLQAIIDSASQPVT